MGVVKYYPWVVLSSQIVREGGVNAGQESRALDIGPFQSESFGGLEMRSKQKVEDSRRDVLGAGQR